MRKRTLDLIKLSRRAAVAKAGVELGPAEPMPDDGPAGIAARPWRALQHVRREAALEKLRTARLALRNVERIAAR